MNCASQEYFGAVDRAALKAPVVNCRFLEEKDGEARIMSFFAKRARGMMARFAIDNRIERAADLKAFDVDGYRFQRRSRRDEEFTFARPQPPPVAQIRAAAKAPSSNRGGLTMADGLSTRGPGRRRHRLDLRHRPGDGHRAGRAGRQRAC